MKIIYWTLALAALPFVAQGTDSQGKKLTAPVVGEAAPGFRLNDDTGAIVTIGGERETWTVLAFYPKAMTPG